MRIKKWFLSKSYWMRGGIIGAIISVLLSLLTFPCLIIIKGVEGLSCVLLLSPVIILFTTFNFLDNFFAQFGMTIYLILVSILQFIAWVVIGVLLGWIIGKIKSKT